MLGDNVSIGQAAVICVFSMIVIFAVLLVISLAIDILAVFQRKSFRHPSGNSEAVQAQAKNPDMLIITAAIAAYLGKGSTKLSFGRFEQRKTENQSGAVPLESTLCTTMRRDKNGKS